MFTMITCCSQVSDSYQFFHLGELTACLQGQMDEDVQKALKQILMMCKMPGQAKDDC